MGTSIFAIFEIPFPHRPMAALRFRTDKTMNRLCLALTLLQVLPMAAQPARPQADAPLALAWGAQADHPLRKAVESAPTLTRDLVSQLRVYGWRHLNQESLKREPAYAPHARSLREAKDEFERHRIQAAIGEEIKARNKAMRSFRFYRVVQDIRLGEYDFGRKCFSFREGPAAFEHEAFRFIKNPWWSVIPASLPMDEKDAENFIRRRPDRTLTLVILLDMSLMELGGNARALNERIEATPVFCGIFSGEGAEPRSLVHCLPSVASLRADFVGRYDALADRILAQDQPGVETLPSPSCNRYGEETIQMIAEDMERARSLRLPVNEDPRIAEAAARAARIHGNRTRALLGLLKTGRAYQGSHALPTGSKRPFTLVLTRKDPDGRFRGTATYAKGQKAVVLAGTSDCVHGPGLTFDFYEPSDDEIGAGDCMQFHVHGGTAIGMAPEAYLDYRKLHPTRIRLN